MPSLFCLSARAPPLPGEGQGAGGKGGPCGEKLFAE